MDEFDYVIVGAGSAGSVIAARLAEIPGITICVLEAGPNDRHPLVQIPVGWMKLLGNPRFNWMYETEASDWTGGRRIPVPRGKTLGGSSSINGNIFNRGAPSDFDHWAQRGNPGWSHAGGIGCTSRECDAHRFLGQLVRTLSQGKSGSCGHI